MVKTLNLPLTPEEFSKQEKQKAAKLWPESTMLPGVRELVTHLHAHKIPIAGDGIVLVASLPKL